MSRSARWGCSWCFNPHPPWEADESGAAVIPVIIGIGFNPHPPWEADERPPQDLRKLRKPCFNPHPPWEADESNCAI